MANTTRTDCSTPRGCEMCDQCGSNSRLYEAWAVCRSCRNLTCSECAVRGTWHEGEDGARDEVLCRDCADMDALEDFGVPRDGATGQ